ncbi:hypothetical protein ACIQZB_00235 [Streptomyces sp. NPDC097727]|uniref:hypothetical protein n=1 Tax=Streptomyces sp. NPDC097727 TaxID=3366092 RepID=UPI0038269902
MATGGNFTNCNCGPAAETCQSPTQPVATVGLCLADGSPIAVTVVRDCTGTVTSEGWINLTTGTWSAGAPPTGTIACGDSRSIQVSGTFCDVDPGTGDVLGLVLVEYSYAADGSIAAVRLVDAVTGDTYTPQGEVTTCPAGVEQPERDLVQLCDVTDAESGAGPLPVPFLRDYQRDENGQITGHSDYTLDGAPYVPTGAVGVCPVESVCRDCQTLTLCDVPLDTTPAPVLLAGGQAGARTGTATNGIGWHTSSGTNSGVDNWFPISMFPVAATGPFVLTLDRPAAATWSARVGITGTTVGRIVMPAGTELVELAPRHAWDAASRTLSAAPGSGQANTNGESRFAHRGPVTALTFASDGTGGLGATQRSVGAFMLAPATVPFLRTTCRDCDGLVLDTTDTLLDGATPYTPAGTVGVCHPPETEPCASTVATLRLCDLNPNVQPDETGKRCAVPFLRHLVHDCTGALVETRDTAMDGTTAYTPVEVVDCGSGGVPAQVEVPWQLVSVTEDPAGTARQDFIFTLSPEDDPTQVGTVRVHASRPAGGACGAYDINHLVFSNTSAYKLTLDEVAQQMTTLRLDLVDFDSFEPVQLLAGTPEPRLGGTAVWNAAHTQIVPTQNNGTGTLSWDSPPATISYQIWNTGGGTSCSALSFAGITLRPEGCCGCSDADPCRNASTLLVCDLPTDGTPDPTVTDTNPTPYYPYATGAPVAGAQVLWGGGTLDLPPGTAPQPGTTGSVNSLAATIQAPRPACDTGIVHVTVSVSAQQTGPDDGCGPTGHLRLFNGTTQAALTVLPANTPFGYFGRLTVEADVPAADLAAGNIAFGLALDAYDDSPSTCSPSPRRTGWQLSAFTATVTYDQADCATQFLRTVTTDCETGNVVSVVDSTLDGDPYTVTGKVGQCQATGGGGTSPEPCRDTSALLLCDTSGRLLTNDIFDSRPLATGPTRGTLANGVTWGVNTGVWTGRHYIFGTGNPFPAGPQEWTFDRPVTLRFGVANVDSVPLAECMRLPATVAPESIHPNHVWDPARRTLCASGSTRPDDVSVFTTIEPVTSLELASVNPDAGIGTSFIEVTVTEPQQFLRTIVTDCETGEIVSVTDTTLDGDPYTVTGDVGQCQATGGGEPEQPCRDTSSTLLCDTAATDVITVLDPATRPDADGWEVVSFTGAKPDAPPEAPLPYPARYAAVSGLPVLGARADMNAGYGGGGWAGYDVAPVRWVLRKEFTAPEDGVAVAQSVGFRGDGGARVRINGIDAGMYGQWNQPASSGTARIPVTAGPNTVEIEVRDTNGLNYITGRLDLALPRTVQFMRRTVVDCETGATVSVTDTTLDGDPYTVVGEVGQCEPVAECCEQAAPEQRVDVETQLLCVRDTATGEVLDQVLVERVYDDQTGDLVELRVTDPTTTDPITIPAGAELALCPSPDRITRQICVVSSGQTEFRTNAANSASGQDTDWQWAPNLDGTWYPMYRVTPNAAWTLTDPAPAPAHWVSPHQDKTVCSPNLAQAPNVTGTWYTRASWMLPSNVAPDTIRIAASVLNADNDVVQWRLNDGAWQPVGTAVFIPPAWSFPATAVPGGRAGQNDVVVQITETQPAVTCPSPNQAGMMLHVVASYDFEPRVWTQVIEDGSRVYYLDENGDRQDAIPAGDRIVPCGGSSGECCPWRDAETLLLCDTADDGATTQFVRALVYNDADPATPGVIDTDLDGQPYTVTGTVGQCGADSGECRDASTILLCDADPECQAGGTPTVADEPNPSQFSNWGPVGGWCLLQTPGQGGPVWTGGSAVLGPDVRCPTSGTGDTHRTIGARLTAGSATLTEPVEVTVSLRVTNQGPNAGYQGDGRFALWDAAAGTRITHTDVAKNAPVGHVQTLALTAKVPAAALASGDIAVILDLETYHGAGPKAWLVDEFEWSAAVPVVECESQFLRKIVTDCKTGKTISVTDTTLDGEPYEVTGEVGQCSAAGTGGGECCPPPPWRDAEVLSLCDTADGQASVPFLRHIIYGEHDTPAVLDTTLDGATPYTVVGEAGQCTECPVSFDTECVGVVERTEASYDNTSLIGGVPGKCGSVQGPNGQFSCETSSGPYTITSWIVDGAEVIADAGKQFAGGPCGPGTPAAPGMHLNWAQALTNLDPTGATWTAQDAAGCAWHVRSTGGTDTVYGSMTITGSITGVPNGTWILGPAQSCAEAQYTKVYVQECDGTVSVKWLTAAGVETSAPAGDYVRCGTGCGGNGGGQGTDAEALTLCDTQADGTSVPFLRHLVYDADGAVAAVVDTDLSALAPYTPTGTVGVCAAEDRAHVVERCLCDDTDGDGVADTDYVELVAVDTGTGALNPIGTYTPDYEPYTPVMPTGCETLGAEPATGVQAHRVELAAGETWHAAAWPTLQSVTAVARGTGTVTTADGTSTLVAGESVTWSVVRDVDALLTGPLTVTADTGTIAVAYTTGATL